MVSLRLANTPDSPRCGGTLGHQLPEGYNPTADNRHDIAVLRLATPQTTPTIRLATVEPRAGARVVTAGWGCTKRAVRVRGAGDPTPVQRPDRVARQGIAARINRGDSDGPLLVRPGCGPYRQVGVTALGSDSNTKLYAGFHLRSGRVEVDLPGHRLAAP